MEEKTREQIESGLIGEGDLERVGEFRALVQREE